MQPLFPSLVLHRCALGCQMIKTWKTIISVIVAAQITFVGALYVVVVANILKSARSFCILSSFKFAFFTVCMCFPFLSLKDQHHSPCSTANKVCTMSVAQTVFKTCFIVSSSYFLNIRHLKNKFISTGKYQSSVYFKKCFKDTGNCSFRVS